MNYYRWSIGGTETTARGRVFARYDEDDARTVAVARRFARWFGPRLAGRIPRGSIAHATAAGWYGNPVELYVVANPVDDIGVIGCAGRHVHSEVIAPLTSR